jgi:hypothetical protein
MPMSVLRSDRRRLLVSHSVALSSDNRKIGRWSRFHSNAKRLSWARARAGAILRDRSDRGNRQ